MKTTRFLPVLIAAVLLSVSHAAFGQAASGTPAAIRYGFAVDWSRERISSKDKAGLKTTAGEVIESTTSNTYVGHAKITNRSSAVLENLEVQIQMHYKVADGKAQTDEQKTTTKTIPSIRPNETVTVDTDKLVLKVFELKGGYTFTNGAPVRQADSIRGAIITLHHGGNQVFEYVSSPALKNLAGKAKPGTAAKK